MQTYFNQINDFYQMYDLPLLILTRNESFLLRFESHKMSIYQHDETLGANFKTAPFAVLTDSKKLADMSYTLANGGVNKNGKRILKCKENRYVLSQMAYGGMYNASGNWFQKYGIPMKSGVGGAIIAVIPGQMAISVVSPPLDKYGNSELGGRVIELLAEKLKFHMYGFCDNM